MKTGAIHSLFAVFGLVHAAPSAQPSPPATQPGSGPWNSVQCPQDDWNNPLCQEVDWAALGDSW